MSSANPTARDSRGREACAHPCLTLLLLDTREGDAAEHLYRKLRWNDAGRIPDYTHESDGSRHATILFYRTLQPAQPRSSG